MPPGPDQRSSSLGQPTACQSGDNLLLQLQNESSLPIKFWVRLESLSKKKAETYQQLPKFLTSQEQRTEIVGELTDALPGTTGIYSSTGSSMLGHEGGVWGGVG